MVKGIKVKIHAPFMNIPIGNNGKDVKVLMDRHFVDKFNATKFALGYTEIYHGKDKPKIF